MRSPRKLAVNARYHVSARINRREMILDSTQMKRLFLDIVARAKQRYKFDIENFTILGNHFHFIIRPASTVSLSRIMQWILSVFAQAYNRLRGITGHVWGERFFSKIIQSLSEFLAISDYIDNNPVKAGLVKRADLWDSGGMSHRRRGINRLVAPLPAGLELILTNHSVLLIGYLEL